MIKPLLKSLRDSQPFNRMASSGLKAVMGLTGADPAGVYKYLPRIGVVHARLPNGRSLRLESCGDDAVTNLVFWKGWAGFEPGVSDVFYRLAARSAVVFDVGAHVGFYSLTAALANPGCTVHAFEPLPGAFERLTTNVALNGLENVVTSRFAAGAGEGTAEFFSVDLGYLPSASTLRREFLASHPGLVSSTVPVVPLDSYVDAHAVGRVDLVKVDTETTEPEVLRGMLGTLTRDRPAIICEVLGSYDAGQAEALNALLTPLGYHYYLLSPRGPVPAEKITGHEAWWNYLCTIDPPPVVAAWAGQPLSPVGV